MSTALNLSEGDCVRYWMAASRNDCRRRAEQFVNVKPNTFEVASQEVATYLFFLEGFKLLEVVLMLSKHRLATSTLADDRAVWTTIISVSNEWLKEGLVGSLLKSIRTTWDNLLSVSVAGGVNTGATSSSLSQPLLSMSQKALQVFTASYRHSVLLKVVEILFFVLHTTKLLPQEYKDLLELMQTLSNSLVDSAPPSEFMEAVGASSQLRTPAFSQPNSMAANSGTKSDKESDDCKRLCMQSFIILQLGLASSLNQKGGVLNRDTDAYDVPGGQGKDLDSTLAGFSFPTYFENSVRKQGGGTSEPRHAMRSVGFCGFCYLVLAQHLQQQYVDYDKESSERVIYFLHQASQHRAYTYLRLCVIPIVASMLTQTQSDAFALTTAPTTSAFLIDVLHEILADIAVLFDLYPLFNDFHFPDPDFLEYVQCRRLTQGHTENPTCDYIDDVMNCFALMANIWPSFALHFATQGKSSQSQSVECLYHPFFEKCRQICVEDRSLRSFVNLCRGIGVYNIAANNIQDKQKFGVNSKGVYAFLRSHEWRGVGPEREDSSMWGFLLCFFSEFAKQIRSKTQVVAATGSSTNYDSTVKPLPAVQAQHLLSKADTEFLTDIADLVATLSRCPEVAQAFIRDANPIPDLFALVCCPVSVSLKGAIFRALSSISYGCPESCAEIWNLLEENHILMPPGNQVSMDAQENRFTARESVNNGIGTHQRRPATQNRGRSHGGILADLEGIESESGWYPCTTGFLMLLESLLTHSIPADVGGHTRDRVPGIHPYVDFVLDDVLDRVHTRVYLPAVGVDGATQKFRMIALSMNILCMCLKHYGVNLLSQLETDTLSNLVVNISPNKSSCNIDIAQLSASEIYKRCQQPAHAHVSSGSLATTQSNTQSHGQQQPYAQAVTAATAHRNQIIADLAADFLELQQTHTIDRRDQSGTTIPTEIRVSRLKSSGFIIMAMLLGGINVASANQASRRTNLLDFILNILDEHCSLPLLSEGASLCSRQTLDACMSLFAMMQPPSLHTQALAESMCLYGDAENLSDFGVCLSGFSTSTVTHAFLNDLSYWKEKTVAACVGLLYECSLREHTFNKFVHRSNTPITFTRFSHSSRSGHAHSRVQTVPVTTQSLALRIGSTVQLSVIGGLMPTVSFLL
jgi:hypothetical protein